MRRVIGTDIHRIFAEVVVWEDGQLPPTSDCAKEMDIDGAAHISAAASGTGARRYRADMTTEQRKSHENGIWLC
ncbi:hypothetical protein [Mesorhizobium sp.]|uniref:hypothetical protein n=1 Tax=Mesorhizobium sp. TaxID=1871066 RepID=UPI00122375A8|nr:hypothetical protein [Mesorhizobium sp.]TIN74505.1 MAG: hypothetical protein E5Y09_32470 [Mesorhizobium sp.]TIO64515.1 MAG: hypothetical protein E5X85_32840 [Mesorhizobium sp.]TJV86211.1 MAG: hypothetical protein E5X84_31820 [Mesorhizobium sp.]